MAEPIVNSCEVIPTGVTTFEVEKVGKLGVGQIYKDLMEVSLGEGSAYLRAKETVTALTKADNKLTVRERADIISSTVSSIATSISSQALNAAITVAKEERDAPYLLAKIKMDSETAAAKLYTLKAECTLLEAKAGDIGSSADLKKAQVAKMKAETLSVLAGIRADTGLYAQYDEMQFKVKTNEGDWEDSVVPTTITGDREVKRKQMIADTYISYASSYRTNGVLTDIQLSAGTKVDDEGEYYIPGQLIACSDSITEVLPAGSSDNNKLAHGLTYHQTRVANRNEGAFDDNMRQHVANASSNMLGVMLGSSVFTSETSYEPFLAKWMTAATYLNNQECPAECNDCND